MLSRVFEYWRNVDPDIGKKVEEGVGAPAPEPHECTVSDGTCETARQKPRVRRERPAGMIGGVKAVALGCVAAAGLALAAPAAARPSDPGVVNYAVLKKGSVGNIVGARLGFESTFADPFQAYSSTSRSATTGPTSGCRRCTSTRTSPRSAARPPRSRRPT